MVIVVSLLKKPTLQQKKHETKQIEGCRTSGSNSPTDCIACKHLKVSYPYREGHTGDFKCVAQCPQHMESDTATTSCKCIKRMEETRPEGVVDCVTECPLTHFEADGVCKECSSLCKDVSNEDKRTCSGPASTDCDTCKYQHDGRCVDGCRPGQKAVKGCADGYVYHQHSQLCYKAFNDTETYDGAVRRCSSDGGTLAMPRDNVTNNFLIHLKNAVDNNALFLFGLTDDHQEGVWMWDDNVPLGDFRAWGQGQPDNYNGNEDCAEYNPEGSYNKWNDGPCTRDNRKFICQASPSGNNSAFTCHQCRPGHECKLGDEREDICPAGTASNDNRTMCVPCAAGEFSSAPGAASCQKCPAGKYSTGGGSTSCLDCPAGKYSDVVGPTGCKVCPAGQYSNTAGSNGCTDCPTGQYSDAPESTGCKACPVGKYSDAARSTGCKDCPAGQYSDATRSTGCKACPAGKYSDAARSTGCKDCSAGLYNSRTGSNRCWDCPAGQYSSNAGSNGCTDCPAGRYSNTVRSTSCTPCPAGQYSSGTRSTGCTNCPDGIFTSTAGSERCTACRHGETVNAAGRPACQGTQRTALVCEDQTMSLSCDSGLEIQVQHAMYGRKDGSTCKKGILLSQNCESSNSLSKVREYCQGHRTCSVQASNSVFGEPCFGTAKYLEATYTCIGNFCMEPCAEEPLPPSSSVDSEAEIAGHEKLTSPVRCTGTQRMKGKADTGKEATSATSHLYRDNGGREESSERIGRSNGQDNGQGKPLLPLYSDNTGVDSKIYEPAPPFDQNVPCRRDGVVQTGATAPKQAIAALGARDSQSPHTLTPECTETRFGLVAAIFLRNSHPQSIKFFVPPGTPPFSGCLAPYHVMARSVPTLIPNTGFLLVTPGKGTGRPTYSYSATSSWVGVINVQPRACIHRLPPV
ncbi:hypothetical protein Bbelb_054910 [Branchiostoma belcheri]|nr:hypothetical protein Bbelb_054910 [Branchiostoma belcheri]